MYSTSWQRIRPKIKRNSSQLMFLKKYVTDLLTKMRQTANAFQADKISLPSLFSPAHQVRKVGFEPSDSRDNPWRFEANFKLFLLRFDKSFSKLKNHVLNLLTDLSAKTSAPTLTDMARLNAVYLICQLALPPTMFCNAACATTCIVSWVVPSSK